VSRPLVSVVMPTYNRERLASAAIESILGQTLRDLELLLVDDASSDGSAEALSARARSDPRVRLLRMRANRGCNAARNQGFRRARGRYVALLDDDDLALPGRLEASVARLEAEPELDVVSCGYRFIDVRGVERPWAPPAPFLGASRTEGEKVFEHLYCDWAWLPTSTLALRTELLARHRYPRLRRSDGDSIFVSRMAASGVSFARLEAPLALMRRDESYAFMSRDRARLFAARRKSLRYLRAWLARHGIRHFDHLVAAPREGGGVLREAGAACRVVGSGPSRIWSRSWP
jgi:glycosyltransferase involved in cell wall biosynthesis